MRMVSGSVTDRIRMASGSVTDRIGMVRGSVTDRIRMAYGSIVNRHENGVRSMDVVYLRPCDFWIRSQYGKIVRSCLDYSYIIMILGSDRPFIHYHGLKLSG